ncbi:MAG TPA: bifunctional diguanylate cyclase/phosphodiesterase [Steroidobacteraceae bacterium]|nr:bifunctional diguanylate cyclase/phosphodiesterase [Steroidobacteraceae bacterium]
MARSASQPPSGTVVPAQPPAPTAAVEAALARVRDALDAVFVAVHAQGGRYSLSIARDKPGARLIEDLWRHGAEGMLQQVHAGGGSIGTNRLRGQSDGPVCGKLVASALRDRSGAIIGLLAAVRMVDQPKFGPTDSAQLGSFAAEMSALMNAPTAESAGLLSWSAFQERARTLENAAGATAGCVLYGDLDQLHVLNKLAGLGAGDQAIAAVGEALQDESLPQGAGVCHISGDRFAVYLPGTSLSQGRRLAEQLCRIVSERCANISGLRTRLSISFGVAFVPAGDGELTQALAAAEAACRAAKDRGRGRVEIYQDADQSIVRRNDDVLVASRLRRALETERIGIVAQPLVSLTGDTSTEYFELLVRMVSETGTFISPAHFMSAATRYQMLIDLDRTMLIRVFNRLRSARDEIANRRVRFSLNLSGPTIGDPSFLEWLATSIGENSIPGEWLQFEITETAAVANVAQTQDMIRRLRARGVEFALDDFGTGVSSFAYLKAFDVSMLKLDGSFTRDLLSNLRSESLVRGIAQLGQSMGIQTVAECVETEPVRARLAELGIERAQGFLFGQPVPLESILSAQPAVAPAAAAAPAEVASAEAADKAVAGQS